MRVQLLINLLISDILSVVGGMLTIIDPAASNSKVTVNITMIIISFIIFELILTKSIILLSRESDVSESEPKTKPKIPSSGVGCHGRSGLFGEVHPCHKFRY